MKIRVAIAVTTLAFAGAGCTTMDDKSTTTAQGAGFGAAIGAVAGGIIGHQSGSGAEGALIGALAGGLGGALYGNHVANRKAEYASQEEYLDACIAQAKAVEGATRDQCDALETELARLQTEVAEAVAAAEAEEVDRQKWASLKKEIEEQLAQSQEGLKQVDDEIRIQKEVAGAEANEASDDQLTALNEQIALLEAQKVELTEQTAQLAELSARMSA